MDSKRIAALGALAVVLGACQDTVALEPMYDGPAGAVVLSPEQGGPFTNPVGFVTNSRSGLIHALDLKHGWVLADDPAAPFLWGAAMATGADRILGDIAVYSPATDRVSLFVADAAYGVLVEVPYVVGVDEAGAPIEPSPQLTEAGFVDADSSGDSAALLNVSLSPQTAATEDWTLEYRGGEWLVTGSRSGPQQLTARFLQPYVTDDGSLSFTLSGTATEGDQIRLSVDTGAVEHDLGGLVQALIMLPDQSLLLASVYDRALDETALVVFDPAGGVLRGAVPLPEGAVPWRMSTDSSGDIIYVADARNPAVYEVILDREDVASSAVRTIETSGPVADLAWEGDAGDSEDGGSYEHLFVAAAGANVVDLYDLRADSWKDINPYTPEIDGIRLDAPVTGMAATTEPSPLPERGPGGGPLEDRVVAISTFNGQMLLVEASTGCVAQDRVGPYATLNPDGAFVSQGAGSSPYMAFSESDGQYIRVNPCGGIARSEDWTATFDEVRGGWVVEGVLSGEQATLAYEDERYVSDDGAISFLIVAGISPSTDGDQFRWSTVEGISRIIGDRNGDGQVDEILELPARPTPYSYLAGATGGGWDPVNRKTGVLWPITNSDRVLTVNVETGAIEYIWF